MNNAHLQLNPDGLLFVYVQKYFTLFPLLAIVSYGNAFPGELHSFVGTCGVDVYNSRPSMSHRATMVD